jgi:hypothetical protein
MRTRREKKPKSVHAEIPQKPWRREKIRLRIANIPPNLVSDLRHDLPRVKIKTNERRAKDENKLVVLLELDDSVDCKKLYRFIDKNKISKNNCMLCVSLLTEGYMGGVRVPKFIIELLLRLDCELNFSFIKI